MQLNGGCGNLVVERGNLVVERGNLVVEGGLTGLALWQGQAW